jgi:hypothetical protein
MIQYKDWAPTNFDNKGAFLDDRDDWYVLPTMRTRDSNPLEESNFQTALEMLGDESDTLEVHRFGHWGPGWFEIILVHPDRKQEVSDIHVKLMDYAVLDEDDLSARAWADVQESWRNYASKDFADEIRETLAKHYDIEDDVDWDEWDAFIEHRILLPEGLKEEDPDYLWELASYMRMSWETHDDGPHFRYEPFNMQRLNEYADIKMLPHDCPKCGHPIAPNMVCWLCEFPYFSPNPATQGELPL